MYWQLTDVDSIGFKGAIADDSIPPLPEDVPASMAIEASLVGEDGCCCCPVSSELDEDVFLRSELRW